MNIQPLALPGLYLIRLTVHQDERGGFARVWCADSFAAAGIEFQPVQGNSSWTRGRGTLRGLHFQRPPKADAKLVRVTRGRLHDVVADLRPDSPTFRRHVSLELAAAEPLMLHVPAGCAHGFQLLEEEAGVEYLMGAAYDPQLYDGCRHDDPALGISWPLPVACLSDRDRSWPPLAGRMPGFPPTAPGWATDRSDRTDGGRAW